MTRPLREVERAREMYRAGRSIASLARDLDIPRSTVMTWKRSGFLDGALPARQPTSCLDGCPHIETLPAAEYSYLLGLYLGDGMLTPMPRGVYRLRVVLDVKYPQIIADCRHAMEAVLPNRVGLVHKPGCLEVSSYSKHWCCLFPQHGPGPKFKRVISLSPWQFRIAMLGHPEALIRGLVHSDGCRVLNVVNNTPYPRYHFSNNSDDIRGIFVAACQRIGVAVRHHNARNLSVARRSSVARLDEFIGPKC